MKPLLENDRRLPVQFLNFKRRMNPHPYVKVGPNTIGEYLWPVAISEDGKRIGFSYIEPKEKA